MISVSHLISVLLKRIVDLNYKIVFILIEDLAEKLCDLLSDGNHEFTAVYADSTQKELSVIKS